MRVATGWWRMDVPYIPECCFAHPAYALSRDGDCRSRQRLGDGETRMVNYRRNFVPGGTFFFTVTLVDRRSKLLVDHVDFLRNALRVARQERPFVIDSV